ncbi:MAG: domain S-box protein [Conexibacter sp.]|nr:domain S-box protein [Conexibacter sp.]
MADMVGQMPSAVVVVEAPSGRIVHANAAARDMVERQLGRSIPAVLTADWEIFHPDGRSYAMEEWPLVRSVTTGEEVVDEEYFNTLPDGSRMVVRCSSSALRDEQGHIVGGVLLMSDVSDRKRVEERLAAHASLLDSIDDAVVVTDAEYRLTAWNRGAERLYGYQADEVLGRYAREVATYEGDTARLQLERELTETGRTRIEFTAHRKDGTPTEVELIAVELRDAQGEVSGHLGIHRDVTERARGRREIEAQTLQQAAVAELGLHALRDGALQTLMDEAVEVVARTLDVELAEVSELLPNGDRRLLARSATDGGEAVTEPGAISSAEVPIPGRTEPFGTLAVQSRQPREFSEHEQNFLQTVANVLAAAVERARTEHRLDEVRDEERRRLARDLHDEALQSLTYAIALTQGGSRGSEEDETSAELLAALQHAGRQLRAAIYDLRLASEEDRPFPDLLKELVALHSSTAGDAEIGLEIGAGVAPRTLGKRGTELLRIVGEALTNARRHSGARNVRVVASGTADHVAVEIVDDGDGFRVAESPLAPNQTGIKGMNERAGLLGGELSINSEPGAGTTVRVHVPLGDGHEKSSVPQVRVLLVEDHAIVREAIAAAFEREPGFEVVGQAGSLTEARTMLSGADVLVLDLGLPDGDGIDLIPELRRHNPAALVVVLSASLDPAILARAMEHGATRALDKVAQLDEVVETVRSLRAGGGTPARGRARD